VAVGLGWRPGEGGKTALACCGSVAIAFALKEQLKYAFGRTWPETWTNHNPSWIGDHAFGFHPFHGAEGWASFPSGHTTLISALAAALWQRVPSLRWLAVTLVVLVVLGLAGSDFHWVGDMVAGAFLGTGSAVGVVAFGGLRRGPAAPASSANLPR
jgi:membrane-associated phospholipid phosphatase